VALEPAAWPLAGYTAGTPVARSLGQVAATTTTANTTAGATTIPVNAVPAMFLKPQLTVKDAVGTTIVGPFTCTTWTDTQFQGCNVPANLTSGWTMYVSTPAGSATPGPGNMPGNGVPMVTLNGNVTAGNPKTLSLAAGQRTWAFAANTFFISDVGATGSGSSTQVTCTGATATQFTGCTGVPATKTGAIVTTGYHAAIDTGTLGGFIKIERQDADGSWHDVTMEILNYGIGGPNLKGSSCGDPTPNAVVRLQRLRDNGTAASCPIGDTSNAYEWWANVLYDTRESVQRDSNYPQTSSPAAPLTFNGVMHHVTLDVRNLSRWFLGTAPYNTGTGTSARTDNGGYTVYFSDRRGNRTEASNETGEYGWEDFVNPGATNGAPNGTLDAGEDVNADTVRQVYGGHPSYNGTYTTVPPGAPAGSPYTTAATPTTNLASPLALVNRAVFFRRSIKLTNGSNIRGEGVTGLTIVAENPVHVQGDWNANPGGTGGFSGAHAATAILADALTLLSNNWNDVTSLQSPYSPSARPRSANTWYRMGVIAGKSMIFPRPSGTGSTVGTDGGAHAFLRYLESNGPSPDTIHYRGSMATFYYSRQATGVFKGSGTVVYQIPAVRDFAFDTDFLTPALLPPNTPMFRDMNAVGFSQELRPGK